MKTVFNAGYYSRYLYKKNKELLRVPDLDLSKRIKLLSTFSLTTIVSASC